MVINTRKSYNLIIKLIKERFFRMSLKEFREAKGFDDYYKSTFNLIPEEGENERLADGLEEVN